MTAAEEGLLLLCCRLEPGGYQPLTHAQYQTLCRCVRAQTLPMEPDREMTAGDLRAMGLTAEAAKRVLWRLDRRDVLLRRLAGNLLLNLGTVQPQKGPGMALGAAALPQDREHLGRQLEQAQLIGHGGLALSNPAGGILLREMIDIDQAAQGQRLLPKIKIPALQVLHQS